MIKPYVITLDQAKLYLNITTTDYDDRINLYIPTVTGQLCRKNGICNQSFLYETTATTSGTTTLSSVGFSSVQWDNLYINSVVMIDGEDNEITGYNKTAKTIELKTATTSSTAGAELYIRAFPEGHKPTVAQMIFYRISQGTTTGGNNKEVASKSIMGVSVSYNANDGVSKDGYPNSIIKTFGNITRPRFC